MRRRSSTYLASFDSFMPKVTKAKGQRMPHALRVSAHHAALVGGGSIRRTRGVWGRGEACVARVRRGGLQPRASMFLLLVKCSLVAQAPCFAAARARRVACRRACALVGRREGCWAASGRRVARGCRSQHRVSSGRRCLTRGKRRRRLTRCFCPLGPQRKMSLASLAAVQELSVAATSAQEADLDEAVALLQEAQSVSRFFRGFDTEEITSLARGLRVAQMRAGEKVRRWQMQQQAVRHATCRWLERNLW